jgi:fido (protein-threonine AMPylation protein)
MIFDPFGDFEARGYLRNVFGDKDTETVKRREHQAFRFRVDEALDALAGRPSLNYQDVLDTHSRLFADYYPWAGQDRATLVPDLAVGKGGRYDLFSHPLDNERAIEYGLGLARDRTTMREKPGEIMGLLAYGHPFLEGNGRALMVVHGDVARRADIHIAWERVEKVPYLAALTSELEGPGAGRLDAFLAPYVRDGARHFAQTATMLARNPDLGPSSATESGQSEGSPSAPRRSAPSP